MPDVIERPVPVRRRVLPLLWAVVAVLLFHAPYLWLGSASYVTLDDNLDTEVVLPWLLTRSGTALDYHASTVVPALMNGVPRNALRPGLSLTVLLFNSFEPLTAYLLNQLLVRLVALLGMYRLVRQYGLPKPAQRGLAALLALAWAILPLYSMYGISVLGQPWLLLALLQLRRPGASWLHLLPLVLFPLWSNLVLAGAFVLLGGAAVLGINAVRSGRVAWRAVAGLASMALLYAVVEYPLLYSLLIERQFVPHRVEFDYARLTPGGVGAGILASARYFLLGQYHAGLFLRAAPVLAAGLAVWVTPSPRRYPLVRELSFLLVVLGLTAVFCGFYPQLMGAVQKQLPLLRTFNLSRFHFLTPLLWFVVLVLSLRHLPSAAARWSVVGLQLLIGLAMNTEWVINLRYLAGRAPANEPSYAAYVAPSLFQRIQADVKARTGLEPAQYRVASLGLPPAVASLNGFYTLDAYLNNYPLTYKRQFRPLIADELAQSPTLATYFDAWGNRCYLFSAELGKNFRVGAVPMRTIREWRFNAAAFRKLGGRYVLSAARLATPARSGLRLAGDYAMAGAYWHIWVYEVQ
ncbi:DUF6044 family protein [Hymenobacter sp. AT01-02]|uniref:DUF6044 family protein n=1 Tax=Hymenobacter sp. AT01-02 TaxID=1571877 RepID=UPI0005F1FF94|nr:DUF6044 family protein [Hymenobacter sp. AT01-02]